MNTNTTIPSPIAFEPVWEAFCAKANPLTLELLADFPEERSAIVHFVKVATALTNRAEGRPLGKIDRPMGARGRTQLRSDAKTLMHLATAFALCSREDDDSHDCLDVAAG